MAHHPIRKAIAFNLAVVMFLLPVFTTPKSAEALQYDQETGLYYNRARMYNPQLGRFMQRDPHQTALILLSVMSENTKTPMALASLNARGQYLDGMSLYQYARSNPINSLDPSGEILPIVAALLVGAVIGAVGGAIGEWLYGDNPTAGSVLTSFGIGAVGGAVGGGVGFAAAAGLGAVAAGQTAWAGIAGIMALPIAGAAEGGVDAGIQSALSGNDAGRIATDALGAAAISGLTAGVLGFMARAFRGGADELADAALEGATRAQKGIAGEAASRATMLRAGYSELPARLPSNNVFDGVFVKWAPDGAVDKIVITESKFSSTGRASLAKTKTMGTQLSDQWIDANIRKMMASPDKSLQSVGELLLKNRSSISTKFSILGPDGINRWQ